MKKTFSLSDIENILHHLNYRWKLEALALWKGDNAPFETHQIYEGYEAFINPDTLTYIDRLENNTAKNRLRHALIDHYLQRVLLPHETEMRAWMRGAVALVHDERLYFRDVIPWCQKSGTYEKRQILQKETGPLCKFLKPFALNYWNVLLDLLRKDLGFENYLTYCEQKKEIPYARYYETIKKFLSETDELYFPAMERWTKNRFGRPLSDLTRFDAIKLLCLEQFDLLFPDKTMKELTTFFRFWQIMPENLPGLQMELGKEKEKASQGISFLLQIPEEVYILMRPRGGWIDIETLWHELGHGFSAVFTSPELSITDRDMATTFALSESYAFFLQNLALSRPVLEDYLGLSPDDSEDFFYHKTLRDISVFRRYAAKFMAEFEMFSSGDLSNGERYAELMARYTGFYYQPEGHLFDLVPEFYCLEYLLGWMGAAILEDHLRGRMGERWAFCSETGDILKKWWEQGNQYNIFRFMDKNNLGPMSPAPLLKRWNAVLNP